MDIPLDKRRNLNRIEEPFLSGKAQLGHTSANMTKRYSAAQLKQREKLALTRRNPFDNDRAAG